jgi:hypothetical protein
VTLIAYYDASGKAGDSDFITLAGIAAPEGQWSLFNALWYEALKKHRLTWWHTAEAMQGKPNKAEFVEPEYRDSWNEEKAQAAFDDLNRLVFTFLSDHYKDGFQICTSTVNMADYRAAKAANRSLRPAEAICVNTCVGGLALPELGTSILLYFDANEEFRKQMEQVWLHGKKKPGAGWPHQVREIKPATARTDYAVQAADLIAWHRNRIWNRHPGEPKRFSMGGFTWRYFDQLAIEEEYPPEREQRTETLRRAVLKPAKTHRKKRDERT